MPLLLQGLSLTLLTDRARAQHYCGMTAETIDPPTNIRSLPSLDSAIRCQLRPYGRRLLVYPITMPPTTTAPRWFATMACERGLASHPGMGGRAGYVHRSQIRLLAIDASDWPADQGSRSSHLRNDGCQGLWKAYGQPLP